MSRSAPGSSVLPSQSIGPSIRVEGFDVKFVFVGAAAVDAFGSVEAGWPPYFDRDSPGSRMVVLAAEGAAKLAGIPPGAPCSGNATGSAEMLSSIASGD